ncbi:hypothetical protein AALP_AA5G107000 [Arabis alpina]|uniref:TIR domain-containing protein n=1 Tax=Arabis alpina TaxID=50452 RepID=A0A087GW97_ARAAL|nr:hypothetical protein AALP_AA5G107000 [Arabis alpina]
MASSSSSWRSWRFDVFPSFSGEDVPKSFLSHLLEKLRTKLIITFIDHGIERSRPIAPELLSEIRDSRISIVVFSKNYASSTWCLNELAAIHDFHVESGQMVIPVFYDVDPSHVRKQTGEFGKAFETTCGGKTEDDIKRWKKAIACVASITGEDSRNWKTYPPDGFIELAKEVMNLAGNLPLGLNVLGLSLRGKGKKEWVEMMPRLRNGLNGKIEKTLRVGYDGLDAEDQEIFIYIACLLNGHKVKILNWDERPLKCMPTNFKAEYLVKISIKNSTLDKMWEGTQPLRSLKKMSLAGSRNLKEIPDLSYAINLEKIDLFKCRSLVTLPSSVRNLKKLRNLRMTGCSRLEVLPADVNLESLKRLDLVGCSRLRSFPKISKNISVSR